jgi:hypothetical protein
MKFMKLNSMEDDCEVISLHDAKSASVTICYYSSKLEPVLGGYHQAGTLVYRLWS